jgi:hypothetical protein
MTESVALLFQAARIRRCDFAPERFTAANRPVDNVITCKQWQFGG